MRFKRTWFSTEMEITPEEIEKLQINVGAPLVNDFLKFFYFMQKRIARRAKWERKPDKKKEENER